MLMPQSLQRLIRVTGEYFAINPNLIFRQPLSRHTEMVQARCLILWLAWERFGWPYMQIARYTGVHHTTVMSNVARFRGTCEKNPRLVTAFEYVDAVCRSEGVFAGERVH